MQSICNLNQTYLIFLIPVFFLFLFFIIQVPPKISPFSFGDDAMNSGDTVSVQCTIAGGDLPLEVRWTLNDRPLEPYLEIITQKLGKRINNLIIDSVSAKHAGNYTCIAENSAGFAQYSSELMVIGMGNLSLFLSLPF